MVRDASAAKVGMSTPRPEELNRQLWRESARQTRPHRDRNHLSCCRSQARVFTRSKATTSPRKAMQEAEIGLRKMARNLQQLRDTVPQRLKTWSVLARYW